jgi:protein O-GlcNAc transferase
VCRAVLAFEVAYPVPNVAPSPCVANGHITFGCLGSQYKITDGVIAAWAAILRRAPASRLYLRNGELSDESSRAALLARFAKAGVESTRIDMDGRAAHFDFLASYARVDIALDTFPYNGGTTTTEALWQGVPVLAFDGDRWASRTSKSLLVAAGLHDWCLADETAYVDRAVALALDPTTPDTLAAMRASMRAHLTASPVCDCERLCRALEDIYRRIAG